MPQNHQKRGLRNLIQSLSTAYPYRYILSASYVTATPNCYSDAADSAHHQPPGTREQADGQMKGRGYVPVETKQNETKQNNTDQPGARAPTRIET